MPQGCRDPRDDRLAARRFTAGLAPLIVIQRCFERGDSFWRNVAQAVFISADCRHLRDDAANASVSGAKDERVTASIARTPQPDPACVDLGPTFQIRYRATPVGDLTPGIHILPRLAVADSESPMIVQQHDKASVSKRFGEFRDTVLPGSSIAVGHRDCRPEMFCRSPADRATRPALCRHEL